MSIDLSKVAGISDSRGVITQIADSAGRVLWSATIKFTMNGVTYEADRGMTWAEWFASDYNTTGETEGDIKDADGNAVSLDAVIVGGTVYEVGFSTPFGSLEVGTSVYFNVNGVSAEFIVIHQGLPSSDYDSSCNGTWVLMKDAYLKMTMDSTNTTKNDYAKSEVHSYLNSTFIGLLESGVKSYIKTVKIPYINGNGVDGSLAVGSNGLATQVFLLSDAEVRNSLTTIGAILEYFDGCTADKYRAYVYGTETETAWWLRTPNTSVRTTHYYIRYAEIEFFISGTQGIATECGVRPAFILPSDLDASNYIS